MTLPSSGTLGFNNINVEIGLPSSNTLSINSNDARALANKLSGQIAVSDFYGKSFATINKKVLFLATNTSPFIYAYRWYPGIGFGSKYTDPASLPAQQCKSIALNPTSTAVVAGIYYWDVAGGPIAAYQWNSSTGFGTRYSNPTTPPVLPITVDFSPNGSYIIFNTNESNKHSVCAYPWSNSTGFGTKFADPTVKYLDLLNKIKFSPAGNAIIMALQYSPAVMAYQWSSSGWGTRYSNPSILPGEKASSLHFTSTGTHVAVGTGGYPYIQVYPWSYTTGFGTKQANPATLPAMSAYDVRFSPSNNAIVISANGLEAYAWSSSGFGAKYASIYNAGYVGITFSTDGTTVFSGSSTSSPYIYAHAWNSSTGFGAKYADPPTIPSGGVNDIAFGG